MAGDGAGEAAAGEARPGLRAQLLSLDSRYWIVNVMEMFERLAYYGVRSIVALYMVLPLEEGGPQFTHVEKGTIFAWWAALQSVLPMFTGGYADRYGHKRTIAVAILMKIAGYIMMAQLMSFEGFFAGAAFLAAGTAVFKPGVQGTLAFTLKDSNASVGWGVFYQVVNVGGFLGPVLAGVLRILDWQYVFYSCAIIVSINFLWLPFYDEPTDEMETHDDMSSPLKVFTTSILGIFRPRVFFFCLVFSGFWLMFNQVFDLLPNVIDDWMDTSGIIATLGAAFATPVVPTVLAVTLGLIYGGICAVAVFLSMRPDRRAAEEVSPQAYLVVAIALWGAVFPAFVYWAPGVAGWAPIAVALTGAGAALATRAPGRFILWSAAAVGALAAFLVIRAGLLAASSELVTLAEAGAQVNPEWMININPGLIVFTMIFFAYLTSFVKPLTSIIFGMVIATAGSVLAGTALVGWVCLAGVGVFSVGEMLSSPKKMEYLATLAPRGQEGLFMGYANIPVAIGWIVGSVFAGNRYEHAGDKVNLARRHLTDVLSMDPTFVKALPKTEVMPALADRLGVSVGDAQQLLFETYEPQQIWVDIALIGAVSIVGMIVYDRTLKFIDGRRARAAA